MNATERLEAARSALAVGPALARGLLRVTGNDRQDYVHRMSTQNVNALRPGQAAPAAFLNAKGHLVGEGTVLVRQEDLLLDLEPACLEATREHLERFVIMDDVVLEDHSAALRVLPVLGPEALARARAAAPGALQVENGRRGAPCVDLYLAAGEAEAIRAALVAAGAAPLDEPDLEHLRVLAGVARFGVDMDASRLPMEAGLTRSHIHFSKGCYLGQEVVLRATVRGHLQKGLVQLALPEGADPGASLSVNGQDVGVVTSVAGAPGARVGLGYVRRAQWQEGAKLDTPAGPATVTKVIVHESA